MDLPVRTKLLISFFAVVLIAGILTVLAGSILMRDMVINEAQRRVSLGLKTARAMFDQRMDEAQRTCGTLAEWVAAQEEFPSHGLSQAFLEELREKCGCDFLHIVSADGVVLNTARGEAKGMQVMDSPIVAAALEQGRAAAGIRLMDLPHLGVESPDLAAQAYIRVVPTPRAKGEGPKELRQAMVMEAASPIIQAPGKVVGAVRGGTVLNRNYEFVDFVRDNIFTVATYGGKNLGTVTIFLGDVRIATNVMGPGGGRAIGTRVSAEVYDKVLGKGETWIGPAFVVDSWYMSAYEPIRNPGGDIVGILYVGVLKDRYDDMRRQATGMFLGIALLGLVMAAVVGSWRAGRVAKPITELTRAAVEVARGNLDYRLPAPMQAQHDEISRLTVAFNEMVSALNERQDQLRESHKQLQETAGELERWNQNYLDTLEFITHELKNQVAAMKINLLAVREGYVGDLTAEQGEALDDVASSVNRTEEMILNYLNLSRIEKGDLEVRARPVQIEADVVQPVLREIRARFEEVKMRVEVDLSADLMAYADPSLLQIVYENLLSNAAKYGREGGLVRLYGSRLNGWVELHVWNEGTGVPADQADELFRKFSRLQTPGEQVRGTGLGLFITREIVRKHGGDIHAESEHGQWIDFVFTLPRPDVVLEERIG